MRQLIVPVLAGAVLAAPAAAQVPGTTPVAVTIAPGSFVTEAVAVHGFAIEAGRLALERAVDPSVRRFAGAMVTDNDAMTRRLVSAAEASGIDPVELRLDPLRQAMLEALQAADAGAFDALYAELQLAAQEDAVALHRAYVAAGAPGPLREAAVSAERILETHRAAARALR